MTEELNLSLPQRKPGPSGPSKLVTILLFFLLTVGVATLLITIFRTGGAKAPSTSGQLSPDACKDLALKLEKQGLHDQAIETWREYLLLADISAEKRAKVWYRVGKLHQDAGRYEKALFAFYRSESFVRVAELETEINRRIEECLEAAGKFAALRYELVDRVGMEKGAAGDEVLAEIGANKITKAEIDRRIEEQIERQITSFAPFMPEDERKNRKEALLKHFSSAQARLHALNQLVLEEILFRKAREEKLTDDQTVRAILRDTERSILAQQVLERELAGNIKITPGDLKIYYEAHKQEYIDPEQARVSHILLKDEEKTGAVLNSLESGADFAVLAKELSLDEKTGKNGGEIDASVLRGGHVPGISSSEDLVKAILSTEAGQFLKEPVKSDRGFHIIKVRERKAERQKPFEEVRSEVYQALRSQKEAEVRERLITGLKERYNVVIHTSRFQEKLSDEPKTGD